MSYKVTLEFQTGRPSYGKSRGTWSMTKEFNNSNIIVRLDNGNPIINPHFNE